MSMALYEMKAMYLPAVIPSPLTHITAPTTTMHITHIPERRSEVDQNTENVL